MADADPTRDLDDLDDLQHPGAPTDRRERWSDAAVAAELATGRREPTVEKARASIVVRLARISLGAFVILLGLALIPLPGPGWLLVGAGLAIWARDIAWAERLLRYVRRKAPGMTEDEIPKRTIVISVVLMLVGSAASFLWWYLRR
jgi:uncharacterized protein (TIGR02611 family)